MKAMLHTMKSAIAIAMATAFNGVSARYARIRNPDGLLLPRGMTARVLYKGGGSKYPPKGWEQTEPQKQRALEAARAKRAQRAARNLYLAGR